MIVLGAILAFSGLLVLGLSPVAAHKVRAVRAHADRVAALALRRIGDVETADELVAVRGTVVAEDLVPDPLTEEPVVFFEVEVEATDDRAPPAGVPLLERGGKPFDLADDSGRARVDPLAARDVAVQHDVWEPEDDRAKVARFLKAHGLSNRADVRIHHRRIAAGTTLLVIGRPALVPDDAPPGESAGYRDGPRVVPSFGASADETLVLTTSALEAFVERELASASRSFAGVVLLAILGGLTAAAGGAVLVSALVR